MTSFTYSAETVVLWYYSARKSIYDEHYQWNQKPHSNSNLKPGRLKRKTHNLWLWQII